MADAGPITLDELLDRFEACLDAVEELPDADRDNVFELLDVVDHLHRVALGHVSRELDAAAIERLRAAHPSVAWLWDAYGVGLDARAAARRALDDIRPYIHSHGGEVEVIDVDDGVVRVRLSGACSGCSASAITLQQGVEEALRTNLPNFAGLEVEEDPDATPHAPPGPTLLQIQPHPDSSVAQSVQSAQSAQSP